MKKKYYDSFNEEDVFGPKKQKGSWLTSNWTLGILGLVTLVVLLLFTIHMVNNTNSKKVANKPLPTVVLPTQVPTLPPTLPPPQSAQPVATATTDSEVAELQEQLAEAVDAANTAANAALAAQQAAANAEARAADAEAQAADALANVGGTSVNIYCGENTQICGQYIEYIGTLNQIDCTTEGGFLGSGGDCNIYVTGDHGNINNGVQGNFQAQQPAHDSGSQGNGGGGTGQQTYSPPPQPVAQMPTGCGHSRNISPSGEAIWATSYGWYVHYSNTFPVALLGGWKAKKTIGDWMWPSDNIFVCNSAQGAESLAQHLRQIGYSGD